MVALFESVFLNKENNNQYVQYSVTGFISVNLNSYQATRVGKIVFISTSLG